MRCHETSLESSGSKQIRFHLAICKSEGKKWPPCAPTDLNGPQECVPFVVRREDEGALATRGVLWCAGQALRVFRSRYIIMSSRQKGSKLSLLMSSSLFLCFINVSNAANVNNQTHLARELSLRLRVYFLSFLTSHLCHCSTLNVLLDVSFQTLTVTSLCFWKYISSIWPNPSEDHLRPLTCQLAQHVLQLSASAHRAPRVKGISGSRHVQNYKKTICCHSNVYEEVSDGSKATSRAITMSVKCIRLHNGNPFRVQGAITFIRQGFTTQHLHLLKLKVRSFQAPCCCPLKQNVT